MTEDALRAAEQGLQRFQQARARLRTDISDEALTEYHAALTIFTPVEMEDRFATLLAEVRRLQSRPLCTCSFWNDA